ncbi:MAG: hypothetical protein CVU90_01785 [Firmicutes bacterium HGW-Firmicutes-15]|nr:MAG: hypothetical protein CVU90_01785 [Firmicutes bacterium HGW-Firmicutes-15]
MQIIVKGKRLQIGLLLCSLLLLEYFNFGIFSSAQFISSGMSEFGMASSSKHSSMSDSVYAGLDFLVAINDGTRFNIASAGKSRGPSYKNNYASLAVLSAYHVAGLINYLRLSKEIYNQFDSIQITTFLHKKDGMK